MTTEDRAAEKVRSERKGPRAASDPSLNKTAGMTDGTNTTTWGGAPAPQITPADETLVASATALDPEDTETLFSSVSAGPSQRSSIAPSSSLHPMLLERIEPSLGRGERLRLDAAQWKLALGRAEESDVRLYTASASREHAVIEGTQSGEWVLTPAPGKSIRVDGEVVSEPIILEIGMNLVLGQDHLRCVTEGIAKGKMAAATMAEGLSDVEGWTLSRLSRANWILLAGVLVVVALGAIAILRE